jgi:hypothetical protein
VAGAGCGGRVRHPRSAVDGQENDHPVGGVLGQIEDGFGHRQGDRAGPVFARPGPPGQPGGGQPDAGEVVTEPGHIRALQEQNAHNGLRWAAHAAAATGQFMLIRSAVVHRHRPEAHGAPEAIPPVLLEQSAPAVEGCPARGRAPALRVAANFLTLEHRKIYDGRTRHWVVVWLWFLS